MSIGGLSVAPAFRLGILGVTRMPARKARARTALSTPLNYGLHRFETRFPKYFPESVSIEFTCSMNTGSSILLFLVNSHNPTTASPSLHDCCRDLPSQQLSPQSVAGSDAFFRCTTLAQRVHLPSQWNEARNFADAVLRLEPSLAGAPRCFSSRHSWAVADL